MEISSNVNQKALKQSFEEAYTNQKFRRLLKTIEVDDKTAMKYTSTLMETVEELDNCSNCPGLIYCKNRLDGHIMYPEKKGNQII